MMCQRLLYTGFDLSEHAVAVAVRKRGHAYGCRFEKAHAHTFAGNASSVDAVVRRREIALLNPPAAVVCRLSSVLQCFTRPASHTPCPLSACFAVWCFVAPVRRAD